MEQKLSNLDEHFGNPIFKPDMQNKADYKDLQIWKIDCYDVRVPTKQMGIADAMHYGFHYSCAYIEVKVKNIKTNQYYVKSNSTIFTLGAGTEVVVSAVYALSKVVLGLDFEYITENFAQVWRKLTSDPCMRWLGPEKGVIHLATSGIVNAFWDLWGILENKPVWKLISDMTPEKLVSLLDFRYVKEFLSPEQAIEIIKNSQKDREIRLKYLQEHGFPAYTTAIGWSGMTDEMVTEVTKLSINKGLKAFKAKVGISVEKDYNRLKLIRSIIGNENTLMVDANQAWEVQEAIDWMKKLQEFKPIFIEEPTAPDDVLGHAKIATELNSTGIRVATGEHCANRILHKQYCQSNGYQFCQPDMCRLGGYNEVIIVQLMAKKANIPVLMHTGGLGLCETAIHASLIDFLCIGSSLNERWCEFFEGTHEYFKHPVEIKNGHYQIPKGPGIGIELLTEAFEQYQFPSGKHWQKEKY